MSTNYKAGDILWRDLTVDDAEQIGDFYERVVGWKRSVHPGCDDFNLTPPESEEPVAGVCFRAGSNAGLPAQWIVWVGVDDIEAATATAADSGGEVIDGPRPMGNHLCAVIRDPAGAVLGLIATEQDSEQE